MKNTNLIGILGIGLMASASILNYSSGKYGWSLWQMVILVAIGTVLYIGNRNNNKWKIR